MKVIVHILNRSTGLFFEAFVLTESSNGFITGSQVINKLEGRFGSTSSTKYRAAQTVTQLS